jgi:osmoprotectant transport system ATP-binding protein
MGAVTVPAGAASATPAVAFQGVEKRYGDAVVLRDLSLTLPAGQTSAIVGPSGGGKSTLLQLINGVLKPSRGRLEVFGAPLPEDLPTFRRRIGYAVQGSALFPHLTVWNNVTLLARLEGWAPARQRARFEALRELMQLPVDVAERYPHTLSGGQQQRVGLCRAMMLSPPLLLLDEPFSALDPLTRDDLQAHFERLAAAEPVTVVLVTHDRQEALRLAQHLVVLEAGRVVQAGSPAALAAAPATPFVEELVRGGA